MPMDGSPESVAELVRRIRTLLARPSAGSQLSTDELAMLRAAASLLRQAVGRAGDMASPDPPPPRDGPPGPDEPGPERRPD